MTLAHDDIQETLGHYSVDVDLDPISPDTLTDTGWRVGDLDEIGGCMLTPGHPSPVGRTPDGDLAYVVYEDEEYIPLNRADAAALAHLLHAAQPQALGDSAHPAHGLLHMLLRTAAPNVLLAGDESAHGALSTAAAQRQAQADALAHGTSPFAPQALWLAKPAP